ncbi:timeless-domain-containing protein [Dichomitus squalens]|nr:timeless-domain-containing protein [Dichomitus squalens]
MNDPIELSDDDSGDEPYVDRRAILEPPIRSVVEALGGYEAGQYRLGDECYGCLKDLKKYWRKDDTDDDRTVARIFWATRVLPNDLIPILLETAGKGHVEDKRAIACADLITAMTWPIDLAEELKELDETYDKGADYTQLLLSHLHYKAALLRPGVLQALFAITLPCLARDAKERTERDVQIVNVVLYLVRNLAFIKDLPANTHASADHAELAALQSRLVKGLADAHFTDLLLTIAANAAEDPLFNQWNTLMLEILYLLFRGVKPADLAGDQAKQSSRTLAGLLAAEDQRRREFARKANTRHSRFGTTISVTVNPKKTASAPPDAGADTQAGPSSRSYVLHRQAALTTDSGAALDMARAKKHKAPKGKKVDELGRDDNLSLDARMVLQNFARSFVESCFNPLLSSLLKDIKAERAKVTEKDNLRLLFATKWFLEFFLCTRACQPEGARWKFGLVAEVTERGWIVWVLRRMREAQEEKPKLWTELQAGVECLTQFVLALDTMASEPPPPPKHNPSDAEAAEAEDEADVADAARLLQQQIVYNGEVLDIALESVRTYKEGTQSLAYLDAAVGLAYALLRMLERWSRRKGTGEVYVRKRARPKKRRGGQGGVPEGEGVPDVEDEPEEEKGEEEEINETMFTFDQFEQRFAHPEITRTLLAYLARYKDFTQPEQMKRVVNLMHRQAVRQKAEGLYFMVSTLHLFKQIMAEERSLPREQPYKDLVALINFILRRFFKAAEEDSFLLVEAFFPKNRGHWKQFSSKELDVIGPRPEGVPFDTRFPQDLYVKKGYSPSEQMGIAMAALTENGQMVLIEWTKQILTLCIAHRQRIIDSVDGSSSKTIDLSNMDSEDEDAMDAVLGLRGPSAEALAKINDYLIPYVSDEEADAANKNPHLKLLFRLCNFKIMDEDADELEWYIPSVILPKELQRCLNTINQYLETPIDLQGKKPAELLKKKRRRRTRRKQPESDAEDDADGIAELRNNKRKEKRKKEKQQYKSAEFIVDSDVEMGDMDAFLEKERALRQKTAALAASTGHVATMRSHGTRKRRRKDKGDKDKRKRRKHGAEDGAGDGEEGASGEDEAAKKEQDKSDAEESELDVFGSPKRATSEPTPDTSPPADDEAASKSKPKPRPRPRARVSRSSPAAGASSPGIPRSIGSPVSGLRNASQAPSDDELPSFEALRGVAKKRTARLVLSDEEDE